MCAYAAKAVSVDQSGQEDGFVVRPGWLSEMTPQGDTRLVVSVPVEDLARVHQALAGALAPPLGVLYRQKVDRRNPRPNGAPPRDFVALDLALDKLLNVLGAVAPLVYGDARGELWLKGGLGEQLVLDQDGLLFCYPDDPAFRDALAECGVPADDVETIADRDYVKHWFHGENDPLEDHLISALRLTPTGPQPAP
jgi:hypothetical protein